MEIDNLIHGVAMPTIRVVEFSRSPGGRYAGQGPGSGEEYRDKILVPALRNAISLNEKLFVELDGVSGYGSSFLEEAFGGLVRLGEFGPDEIRRYLDVQARTALFTPYAKLAKRYLESAQHKLATA